MRQERPSTTAFYIAYAAITAIAFYAIALLNGVVSQAMSDGYTIPAIDWSSISFAVFGLWLVLEPVLAARAAVSARVLARLLQGVLGMLCVPNVTFVWVMERLAPLFAAGMRAQSIRMLFMIAGGYCLGQVAIDVMSIWDGTAGRDIFDR